MHIKGPYELNEIRVKFKHISVFMLRKLVQLDSSLYQRTPYIHIIILNRLIFVSDFYQPDINCINTCLELAVQRMKEKL